MAYSVVFTWVYLRTRGSVLITAPLHGAINLSQGFFFLGGLDFARVYWLLAAVYGVAALALVTAAEPNLSRKTPAPTEASVDSGLRAKETSNRP